MSAVSEALFPENELGAPDFRDTEMVGRTLEYIEELPPPQRRLLTLLFVFVELFAGLLLFAPRRFSKLRPARRAWAVRRWRRSNLFALRMLGDALKAAATMMYLSHPRVIAYLGAYKTCENPADPLPFPVRPRALADLEVPE